MLSDEEKKAIEVVNKRTERLIEELKIEEEDLIDEPKIAYLIIQIAANKTLLNLIEKQQKEIELLKEENEKYKNPPFFDEDEYISKEEAEQRERKAYIKGTNDAHELCNKKWEDKIKAKIEEYDDKGMTISLASRSAGKTFQEAVHYEVKKVLESLLEKE